MRSTGKRVCNVAVAVAASIVCVHESIGEHGTEGMMSLGATRSSRRRRGGGGRRWEAAKGLDVRAGLGALVGAECGGRGRVRVFHGAVDLRIVELRRKGISAERVVTSVPASLSVSLIARLAKDVVEVEAVNEDVDKAGLFIVSETARLADDPAGHVEHRIGLSWIGGRVEVRRG